MSQLLSLLILVAIILSVVSLSLNTFIHLASISLAGVFFIGFRIQILLIVIITVQYM